MAARGDADGKGVCQQIGDGWVWCGYAGHFVGARNCRFHMHTRVGKYRISTVGDYHPPHKPGDEMETIGAGPDSFFETFVFEVEGMGTHGEGEITGWGEIDGERYATAEAACRGHMAYCWKYDAAMAGNGRSVP